MKPVRKPKLPGQSSSARVRQPSEAKKIDVLSHQLPMQSSQQPSPQGETSAGGVRSVKPWSVSSDGSHAVRQPRGRTVAKIAITAARMARRRASPPLLCCLLASTHRSRTGKSISPGKLGRDAAGGKVCQRAEIQRTKKPRRGDCGAASMSGGAARPRGRGFSYLASSASILATTSLASGSVRGAKRAAI